MDTASRPATYEAREYGKERGVRDPLDSIMFSRTDAFSFSDAPRQHLKVETITLGARGLKLSRVTSSGHHIKLSESDHVTLLLPTHGSLDIAANTREFHAGAGQSLAFLPNARQTRVVRPPAHDYVALVLMVPLAALDALDDDDAEDPVTILRNGVHLGANSKIVPSLGSYLGFVFDDLSSESPVLRTTRAYDAAEVLALEQFRAYLAALRDEPHRVAAVPIRKVREAEAFMRSNFSEALSIADIASAVGVGTRNLQSAFKQVRGTTPHDTLVSFRLDKAHDSIRRGGDGQRVTEIALACGFTHLGRFSQLYRDKYGELPSETLRKSR